MDAEQIKTRIEQATGATAVDVHPEATGKYEWWARMTSPLGLRVIEHKLRSAGFDVFQCERAAACAYFVFLNDTQPAPAAPTFEVGQRVVAVRDIVYGAFFTTSAFTIPCGAEGEIVRPDTWDDKPAWAVWFPNESVTIACEPAALALAPQPGDRLPASDPPEGGDVLGDDEVTPVVSSKDKFAEWLSRLTRAERDYAVYDNRSMGAEANGAAFACHCFHSEVTQMYTSAVAERDVLRAQVDNALATIRQQIAACDAQLGTLTNEPPRSHEEERWNNVKVALLHVNRGSLVAALTALETSEP